MNRLAITALRGMRRHQGYLPFTFMLPKHCSATDEKIIWRLCDAVDSFSSNPYRLVNPRNGDPSYLRRSHGKCVEIPYKRQARGGSSRCCTRNGARVSVGMVPKQIDSTSPKCHELRLCGGRKSEGAQIGSSDCQSGCSYVAPIALVPLWVKSGPLGGHRPRSAKGQKPSTVLRAQR